MIWRRIIFWLGGALVLGGLAVEIFEVRVIWSGQCAPCPDDPHALCYLAVCSSNPWHIAFVAGGVIALGLLALPVASRFHRAVSN